MKVATILAALSRLVEWVLGVMERRREAEVENEVRDAVANEAKVKDLQRAIEIGDAAADVQRVRRDAANPHTGKFRD